MFGKERYSSWVASLPEKSKAIYANLILASQWYPFHRITQFPEYDAMVENRLCGYFERAIEISCGKTLRIQVTWQQPALRHLKFVGAIGWWDR